MGIVITVALVVLSFLVGFTCGYEECLQSEIIATLSKEGDKR